MAQAPVAADVHQQLHVLRDLAAEVALDLIIALDDLPDPDDLPLAELLGPRVDRDPGLLADLVRPGRPMP